MLEENSFRTANDWITRRETIALAILLIGYAALLFVIHGEIRVGEDNPGYTDPSINYVIGKGFTSTCWYAEPTNSFWAGNVPLHQFLLIPWLKLFGIRFSAVIWLNFLYFITGTILLWRALVRSELITSAPMRIGALALFLLTDSAYDLVTAGRHDPLSYLLFGAVCYLLTVRHTLSRLGGLLLMGALIPFAHLGTVLYTAIFGVLAFLFYPNRFWKEVLVFGIGGTTGLVTLVVMYRHLGVWDAFLASIAPHIKGSLAKSDPSWKRGGLFSLDLPLLFGASLFLCVRRWIKHRVWKPSLFILTCALVIPGAFLATAIFSVHYGWYLRLPLAIALFWLFPTERTAPSKSLIFVLLVLMVEMVVPAQFVRKTVKNRLWLWRIGNPQQQMSEFSDRIFRSNDIVWVSEEFFYEAKRKRLKTFSSPVVFLTALDAPYPGEKEDQESISVFVGKVAPGTKSPYELPPQLPGRWSPTGEKLKAWGVDFIVYRRADQPK